MSNGFIGAELLKDISCANYPFTHNNKFIAWPFNLKECVLKYGREIIPNSLGLYHLFDGADLVYIGMSKNLRTRLLYHLSDVNMPFDNVIWFPVNLFLPGSTISDVLKIEKRLIKMHRPSLNLRHITSNAIPNHTRVG